jgi:hypothetical protein
MVEVRHRLLLEAAGAVRDASRQLRVQSSARVVESRRTIKLARRRHAWAEAMSASVERNRGRHYRSAWSDLRWSHAADLDRVLIPHDGDK